jgi:hypothetical protein
LNNYKDAAEDFSRIIALAPSFLSPYYERGILRIADVRRAINIARLKYEENDSELKEAIVALRMMGVPEKPVP